MKPMNTPIDSNVKLANEEDGVVVDKEMNQRLVGRLIYLSQTKLDITFIVCLESQFMHQPKEAHLQDVLRIVQHFKGTPKRGIFFRRNKNVSLEACINYAASIVNKRSTIGYCTFLGGNLTTRKSEKQNVVVKSSGEA